MKKSFQFRIYPNKKQEIKLIKTLDTCRHLYNDSLAERRRESEMNRLRQKFDVFPWGKPEWINYYNQANKLPQSKTTNQKEVHFHVLQNTLKRVDRSFQNYFNGFGYPRFQGRNRYNSFTFPESGFKIKDGKLILSKIGNIKIIQHRPIEGTIKTCTIKKDIDQWYTTFSCNVENTMQPIDIKESIGIDMGLKLLLTLSNGKKIESPKFMRESENKLIHEQKQLSKKKLHSKNRNKQRIKVAKVHRKIRNQRKDFVHKTSRQLVNNYDHIVFENLQIRNMLKNHHLAKSISDAGWYQLQQFVSYKAEWAGKIVEFVNPRGTSQNCSSCGQTVHKDLSVRIHSCPYCGLVLDRDHNAAINILNKSKIDKSSTVGTTGIQACQSSLSIDIMKQEAIGGSSHVVK